jgi:hypothetical protein
MTIWRIKWLTFTLTATHKTMAIMKYMTIAQTAHTHRYQKTALASATIAAAVKQSLPHEQPTQLYSLTVVTTAPLATHAKSRSHGDC